MESSTVIYKPEFNGKQVVITHDRDNNKITASHNVRTATERKQVALVYMIETGKVALNADTAIKDMTEYLALIEFMNTQIVSLLTPEENAE